MYRKDYSKYRNLKFWREKRIGEYVKEWRASYGERIAVVDSCHEVSYGQLDAASDHVKELFKEKGLKSGDKVIFQMPGGVGFTVIFFALMKIGAVPVMMLPANRKNEIVNIADKAKPAAYIAYDKYMGFDYENMADEIKKESRIGEVILFNDEKIRIILEKDEGVMSAEKDGSDRTENADTTALLLLSGGTTGVPKLIPRTHADYMYNAKISADKCRLDKESITLIALPAAHNFSLACPGILGTLSVGGKVVFAESPSPMDILDNVQKFRVTHLALVPSLAKLIADVIGWSGVDAESLRVLQVGGAYLEPALAREIMDKIPGKLMQVFGTAEGLLCFTNLDDSDEVIISSQGRPVSEADEVRIVDENGYDAEDGKEGELIARGPYTIDGYYESEEVNKNCFTEDGFYRTGDKAKFVFGDRLRICGRVREQINKCGEKIMPSEIEDALCENQDISDAAVVGISDPETGSKICAFITCDKGKDIKLIEIKKYLKMKGFAAYKMPDMLIVESKLPLTKMGKIDKEELKKKAERFNYAEV